VLVLVVGAAIGSILVLVLGWPRGDAAPTSVAVPFISGREPANQGGTPAANGQLVVDVAGLVRKPGVVELPVGSRVIDAIKSAGGVRGRGDTTGLNLAQVLTDGQQVLVAAPARTAAGPNDGVSSQAGGSSLVNINTASLEELDALPGIGPVLAQAIVDWRTQNGAFTAIEQLTEVSGIGDTTFGDLQPLVTV
jgi:competence protein ComEA